MAISALGGCSNMTLYRVSVVVIADTGNGAKGGQKTQTVLP